MPLAFQTTVPGLTDQMASVWTPYCDVSLHSDMTCLDVFCVSLRLGEWKRRWQPYLCHTLFELLQACCSACHCLIISRLRCTIKNTACAAQAPPQGRCVGGSSCKGQFLTSDCFSSRAEQHVSSTFTKAWQRQDCHLWIPLAQCQGPTSHTHPSKSDVSTKNPYMSQRGMH